MEYRNRVTRRGWLVVLAIGNLFFRLEFCEAQSLSLESVGARIGSSFAGGSKYFLQSEAFGVVNLPWSWDLGRSWELKWQAEASVGWLGNPSKDAAIGTVGPAFLVRWDDFPINFQAGGSPTLLSSYKFGSEDFGTHVQFTTYGGFNWDLNKCIRAGYRFQHMSNAGLDSHNPGLNMHVFCLSYLF
jgi:hypothetical protein